MAKDGTNRGGRRVKAGSKPYDLTDKISHGMDASVLDITEIESVDLEGSDMPKPSEYLSATQRDGVPLGADEIYRETWKWLKERHCERLVNPRLLESYSQAFARFIQCEKAVSQYGLIGKHPTTGAAISSPFVTMSVQFQKQANLLWEFEKSKKNSDHPTMKPIPLLAYVIQNSSMSNTIVLDPFGGSGSTLIACEQTDRSCYTIELDEKYCDVIVRRYIEQVGSSSEVYVERDGKKYSFDELEIPED